MSSIEDFKIQKVLNGYIDDFLNDVDGENSEDGKLILKTGFRTFDELVPLREKENKRFAISSPFLFSVKT